MGWEYCQNGVSYWREGDRIYRVTAGGLVLDHTLTPIPPRRAWWRRLWAWVRGWL